jgi:endonuclease/exonuclease/phosphatase family metal-dependent hydrolase
MNMFLSFLLIMAWVTYFIPAQVATILSFFSFIVPLLLIGHFVFFLFWMAKKNKKAFLSVICLLVSLFIFGKFYRFSSPEKLIEEGGFSIMSYNVRNLNMNEQMPIADVDSSIIKFILREAPDILSVQEAHYAMRRTTPLDKLYPYKFVDFEYGVPKTSVINALYSKYPILKVEVIDFPKSDNAALFADIAMPKDTIRIYNVHLQSFSVVPDVEHLQSEESGKLLKRILRGLKKQEEQAFIIREHMTDSPYPIIVSGDLNNTQFSKVYRLLKGDFSDSFLEAGASFGKTFKVFELPMRIDYIFAEQDFNIASHLNYDIELSDHYPILTRVRLKSNQ